MRVTINQLILERYEEDAICAARSDYIKIWIREYFAWTKWKGVKMAQDNLSGIWSLSDSINHHQSKVVMVTDNTNFPPPEITDMNAMWLCGEYNWRNKQNGSKQKRRISNKGWEELKAEKVKMKNHLKSFQQRFHVQLTPLSLINTFRWRYA